LNAADPAHEAIGKAKAGDPRALARLISLVENAAPELRAVARALAPLSGRARVVGLTGAPGVGKSTVTAALVAAYRERGERVAVLAVDPTSPFTGGALLGDRVRMQDHATDPGVFIRSMATRGHLGGLSQAAPQADTTLVAVAPGMGDAIQAAKAGILEVGDVFVVNKADKAGAQETVRDLRSMIAMARRSADDWKPPIVSTVAVRGEGIADLVAKVDAHWAWLDSSGQGEARRLARAREEIAAIALAELRRRAGGLPGDSRLDDLAGRVADGKLDPFTAADELVDEDRSAQGP
jgi:LAO/AO transport system kinase